MACPKNTLRVAPPQKKFTAWAETVPYTLRNPLYHWTHLELIRHFGISDLLNEKTAKGAWQKSNAQLPNLRVHDLLANHKVRVLCTTDDPADSLENHQLIRKGDLKTRVYPTFRPDKALQIQQPAAFNNWLERLEQASGQSIKTFDDLLSALKKRHERFPCHWLSRHPIMDWKVATPHRRRMRKPARFSDTVRRSRGKKLARQKSGRFTPRS